MAAFFKRSKTEGSAPENPTSQQQEQVSVMPNISEQKGSTASSLTERGPQTVPTPAENTPPVQLQPEQTTPQTELPSTTEQQSGAAVEQQKPGIRVSSQQSDDAANTATAPAQPQAVKTKEREAIESILSEGLTEIYQGMTPQEQQKFREKGEEAASAIEQMMSGFKATARKVIGLIREWLATIPRVNKYFLEQESKLKTDEMIKLQRKLKKQFRMNKRLGK